MTVGIAMRMPKISVRPRSASSRPIAVSGPGCGGTRPCSTDSPASAGMPTFISDSPVRWATRMTTGTSSTTPTSKNSGSPRMAAMAAIIHGSPPGPTRPTIVATMRLAPPESSSSLPIIAPSAMRMPTAPAVAPNPATKLLTVSPGGIVATAPSTAEPSIRARNGCTLPQVMSTTTARMPRMQAATSCAFPAYTGGFVGERAAGRDGRDSGGGKGEERHQACSFRCPSAASARSRTWAALPSLVMVTPGSSSPSGSSVASWLGSSDGGM